MCTKTHVNKYKEELYKNVFARIYFLNIPQQEKKTKLKEMIAKVKK